VPLRPAAGLQRTRRFASQSRPACRAPAGRWRVSTVFSIRSGSLARWASGKEIRRPRRATLGRSFCECHPAARRKTRVGSLLAPQHKPGAQVDNGYLMAVKPTAEPQHGLTSHCSLLARCCLWADRSAARAARLTPASHLLTSNACGFWQRAQRRETTIAAARLEVAFRPRRFLALPCRRQLAGIHGRPVPAWRGSW
jgi:hypothetical protein